jgi:hypothetical protein
VSPHDFKFGTLSGSSLEVPYEYPDEWSIEQTTGPSRLVIAAGGRQADLLRALCAVMEEPFYLLYVLVVPRDCGEPGRYQSPEQLSKEDVLGFLNRFEKFLESDGRHHLWIKSIGEPDLLVYDRHNLIYAYGRLDDFKKILTTRALAEGPKAKIPSPHVHCYNAKYDDDCRALLGHWNWQRSPLREQDDD